jgi:hypothetical protein
VLKSEELFASEAGNSYIKQKNEDLQSIANGVTGFKGNVTINIAAPMVFKQDDDYQDIADQITNSIVSNYELHATNYAALQQMDLSTKLNHQFTHQELINAGDELSRRMINLKEGARSKFLEQYANPAIRKPN